MKLDFDDIINRQKIESQQLSARRVVEIDQLWDLAQNDATVAAMLNYWRHGSFLSFEDMLVTLCVTLANQKNEYMKTATAEVSKRYVMPEPVIQGDDEPMPFTGHDAQHLETCLKSIIESGLPIEVFDAFLAEYVKTKDLDKARFFAACEWDC